MPRAPRQFATSTGFADPEGAITPPATKLAQPDMLEVLKATHCPVGGVLLIKVPFKSGTADFEIACRNLRNFAQLFQCETHFFGSDQDFEAFALDQNALERLGLQRRV
jgi:hypothetical protein